MGIKIQREDTPEFKVTMVDQSYQEEPTVYDLKYLIYRLDLQKELGLNDMETKLLSFVLSFSQVSDRFYFGNEALGKLFGKHINTISATVSSLEDKGLIECSRQIMAGGGEIRFIRLTRSYGQGTQKSVSKAHRKLGENNNKINNNKISNIYASFIKEFNSIVGTSYKGDSKSKVSLTTRLKDGYSLEEILSAVRNAKGDDYLMGKNPSKRRYLTPEYITRSDKLDQWLNSKKGGVKVKFFNK